MIKGYGHPFDSSNQGLRFFHFGSVFKKVSTRNQQVLKASGMDGSGGCLPSISENCNWLEVKDIDHGQPARKLHFKN